MDLIPNTITFDVDPINSAPHGTDNTLSTLEDTPLAFSAADFGFSDVDDLPADNNFQSVIITTLPTSGILELSGVAVTTGQEITLADLPNLTFTPTANEYGAGYTDFTFQVKDDGGTANGGVDTDTTPNTITIDVTEVNDAPEGTDNTLTTLEDTPLTFAASDFGFTDPNDTPADNLQSLVITALPTNGLLELSGTTVTMGQEIALADIPNLTFTPAANEYGAGYADFTFQVRDDGGTANGGIDLDPTSNKITIDVTSVNDAPEGTDTTVTTLEDTDYSFNAADFGFTDPADNASPNNLQSVIINTLPTTGTLFLSGVAVTAGQEIAVADIPNLTFTPLANDNGTGYADFTFQVRDDGGTANGGIDLDPTSNTITIDVTPVNDEPAGTDNTLTILEDTPYSFNATDFGFSDPIDTPSDALQAVIITSLPADGILELSGTAVTIGQEISLANIPNLTFTPAANEYGAGYTDFTFQVKDDGGTADGGVDTDQSPNTITFNVTEVNDAPEGTDNTVTTLEDTPLTFAASDFGFTDPNDSPANNFQSLVITTLPTNGILRLSGTAVTTGQTISLANIPNLTFTPAADEHGAGYANFTFQVRDDGSTANGGENTDQSPNTMTIDVTSVNDEPAGTDNTLTTLEDTSYNFNATDFGFTDPNDSLSPNNLQSVIITTLPGNGLLELSGTAVTAGQEIAVADIPNLTFTPAANDFGNSYTAFTFQVRDDGGTANGGVDTDQSANTITFNVTPVNDAPQGADKTLTTLEDSPLGFTASDFGFSDPIDSPSNSLQSIIITAIPANGVLELSGTAVTTGQEIAASDIPNLLYVPPLNLAGNGVDNFTFQVRDDGGTANGGVDTDITPNAITIDITPINDAPAGADNTVTTLEDTDYTFSGADFGFTDPDDVSSPNNLQSIIINTLPLNGTLLLSGVAITAGQEISAANLTNLTFRPAANENGSGYADFTFQVRDDGGTAFGGVNLDPTPNTMTIDVTSVNDEPAGADNTLTTLEDTPYNFAAADFGFSDLDDNPSNNFQSIIITSLPTDGILELSGVAVTTGQEIALANIPNLFFTPAANEYGTGYADFTFQVKDDGGTTNGGENTDQSPNTITFDVTSVNDAPEGTDNTVTTLEDMDYTFSAADFGYSDPADSASPNNFQSVIINTLPANGTLFLSGVAVTAGQEIAVTDIPNLTFTPAANEHGASYADFDFQVRDDGGTANGGIDLDTVSNTLTIDVTSVNDEPAGADNTLTTLEDTPYNFNAADFGFSDPDDIATPDSLGSVIITTLPTDGILELSGAAVTAGQEILLADIPNLTFTPNLNEYGSGYTNFTFQVKDDGGTANGGVNTDQSPNTITFDVTQVNDAPLGTDNTLTTLEDTPLGFTAADFGYSDPADNPSNNFQSVIISTLPANGTLELSGVAVTAGQEIALADIPNLLYIPPLNLAGNAADNFTFQVKDDGGTAFGGIDTDITPNSMTIDITPINDAPAGTDNTVTALEDTDYTFNAADFGFTDPDDVSSPNNLQSVIINTLPTTGTLYLSGVAVTAGQEISAADISNLIFTPLPNEHGTGYADFTFQVRDDGGLANGGIDLDPTPNTMTIDVTSVNDEPAGADNTLTTLEDIPYTFNAFDFGFNDPDDTAAPNALQSVIITTLPADGILELSGVAVTAGQEILLADIPNLTFTPSLNDNGAGYTNFTFQVKDDGGTANGGVDTDLSPNIITFDVIAVDDAPVLDVNNGMSTFEGHTETLTTAMLSSSDVDTDTSDIIYTITNPPVNGQLEMAGAPGISITSFTQDDLDNNRVVYVHDSTETTTDSFDFEINDATTNIGTSTFNISITPVNDAPYGTDNTLITAEDTPYTFNAADFGFSDPDDSIPNNFQSVIITTLPPQGILQLSGVNVTAGQEITLADIPNLTFMPDANDFGIGYTGFTFQVKDDGGTANNGVDTDPVPNTITFDVTPVNDAPHDMTITPQWFPEGISHWNVGPIQAYDVDNTNFTYTILSGDPIFSITNSNILTTNAARLFGIDPSTYAITLRASDGLLTYDETFTITLIPEIVPELRADPAQNFTTNKIDSGASDSKMMQGGLQYYIRDFLNEMRNGNLFRYGNQGLIDSSLATTDNNIKDVFYGDGNIDEIIKKNVIIKLQELASHIRAESGVDLSVEQLAETFGLDIILFDMQEAEGSADGEDHNDQDDITIYETNAIYKALVSMNEDSEEKEQTDKTIADKNKQSQRQYLHMQLDEAALYYQSKHNKLAQALEKE